MCVCVCTRVCVCVCIGSRARPQARIIHAVGRTCYVSITGARHRCVSVCVSVCVCVMLALLGWGTGKGLAQHATCCKAALHLRTCSAHAPKCILLCRNAGQLADHKSTSTCVPKCEHCDHKCACPCVCVCVCVCHVQVPVVTCPSPPPHRAPHSAQDSYTSHGTHCSHIDL